MSRSSATARKVGRWSVICSVIAALACVKGLAPPDPNNQLPDGVTNDTLAFQKKIAQYPLSTTSHERPRKAKCFLSLCSRIDVRIEAMGNTLAIDPDSAPASGLPVAHLVNLDNKKTERFYGLLPGTQAEYYLWVDRKAGSNKARWTLLQVSHTANSVTAAAPTDLTLCHKRELGAPPPKPDADFAEYRDDGPCDVPLPAELKVSQASLFPLPVFGAFLAHVAAVLSNGFELEGGWIECSNGCCT